MKKKVIIPVVILISLLLIYLIFIKGSTQENSDLIVTAKKGTFRIEITTSGELEAKNSIQIPGPSVQSVGIWQVKIDKLVDEGTVVKKGDYIATLDKSELSNKMMNADTEFQKSQSQFSQAELDTALTLRQARDELKIGRAHV